MSKDLSLVTSYSTISLRPESVSTTATEKKGLWKQIKEKLGLDFNAKEFISQINKNTNHEGLSEESLKSLNHEFTFSKINERVNQEGPDGLNKLRQECIRAKKIAKSCLKLSPKIDNIKVDPNVFHQMKIRAEVMDLQLTRIENVNKLKTVNPNLASHLEKLYELGRVDEANKFFPIAMAEPDAAKFLLDPRAKENPQFYAEFIKLASNPKTQKKAATIARFLSDPKIQRTYDFFPSMCAIISNPKNLQWALDTIKKLTKPGAVLDDASDMKIYNASRPVRMKNFVAKWGIISQPKYDRFDTATPTIPVDLGNGQILHVEKDNYNERLQQMRMDVDGKLLWKGDTNWKTSMPADDKKAALSAFHNNITEEMNKHTHPPLTQEQSLNVTSCLLRLSSVNGLSQNANSHKIELLKGDFGQFQAATASNGINPLAKLDVNPGTVFKMSFEPDGMVVLKGPVSMEKIDTQDGPKYFGIQTEVRVHIDDLKNIQMQHTDPDTKRMTKDKVPNPNWTVTTRVSPLCDSEESLVATVDPEYLDKYRELSKAKI